jgi:hypothetical protein
LLHILIGLNLTESTMKTLVPLVLVATILAGCATWTPGRGVSPELADSWGCHYDAVMARAAEVDTLGASEEWIPRVGYDACEVLARNGSPTQVEWHETASGQSVSWWYSWPYAGTHLLRLEAREGQWVVAYVGW